MQRKNGTIAALVGLAVLAGAAIRGNVRRYVISQQSMTPALQDGDWVLAIRSAGRLQRGDVVVFDHPGRPGFSLIKRVVAMAPEMVTIRNGQVHIDGSILPEPWANGPTRPDGEWELDGDELFVLSDARSLTIADARAFGPIDVGAARWRVRFRYWPPSAIGRI